MNERAAFDVKFWKKDGGEVVDDDGSFSVFWRPERADMTGFEDYVGFEGFDEFWDVEKFSECAGKRGPLFWYDVVADFFRI